VFTVIVSPRAWRDFFEIFDYIREDSPDAAARFCSALLEHTNLLAAFPHIGVPVTDFPHVRSVLHTPIRVYYRVNDKRQSVEIVHFWHTARRRPKL
jgi:plasmid stabilization system protein ParE